MPGGYPHWAKNNHVYKTSKGFVKVAGRGRLQRNVCETFGGSANAISPPNPAITLKVLIFT